MTTKTEQGLRRLTPTRMFTCVVVTPDLGFHVVIGVGRLTVQFHHAYAIPSTKFFSSGCCSPTVSCHRSLQSVSQILAYFHREKGVILRFCLYTPVGYSRPPPTVNDLSVTK